MKKTFQTLFCDAYRCSPVHFEQAVFRTCLHRHTLLVAGLLKSLNSEFFKEDLGFIRDLATASCRGEVLCELNRFYGRNVRDNNWLRKRLALRLSGKRVLKLSRRLFPGDKQSDQRPSSDKPAPVLK